MANQMIALQARNPQLPDPGRATAQMANMINMMRQTEAAKRQAEQAQQAMDINAAQEARAVRMAEPQFAKAQSEADSARLNYVMDYFDTSALALTKVRDPQQAMAVGQRIKQLFPEPELQASIDETLGSIPQDPAQFEAWREDSLFRTMEAKDQLAQEFQKQTTGTEERIISMPKYGRGAATEVPGSRIQVAEGMQYIKGADGATYAVPTKTGGSFGAPPPAAGAGGSAFSRIINIESRGQQFARNGTPLTSPAGAIGIAQVMPRTAPEAAKLAGLPFDDNRYRNDKEYNYALGEAYFKKQLADFGDESLAAAAYNAGPSAVRRALQKGGVNGWINHVPKETQNYVREFETGQTGGGEAPGGLTPVIPGKPKAPSITPEAKVARDAAVQDLYDAIVAANKKGHLTSEKQSYIANRAQETLRGRTYLPGGTAQKTSLDDIDTAATQLLRLFIQKGTSGTLNTKAEQDNFMRSVGGADASYETRLKTIRNFAKQNGIPLNEAAASKSKASPTKTPVPRKAGGGFTVVRVED